jgi:hypothetical protein
MSLLQICLESRLVVTPSTKFLLSLGSVLPFHTCTILRTKTVIYSCDIIKKFVLVPFFVKSFMGAFTELTGFKEGQMLTLIVSVAVLNSYQHLVALFKYVLCPKHGYKILCSHIGFTLLSNGKAPALFPVLL